MVWMKNHDEIRVEKRSWKRAIAVKHVRNAGMDPYLNIGHYNANTDHQTVRLLQRKDTNL